jgi:aldose 1-epimerase
MSIRSEEFGKAPSGDTITRYTLTNARGNQVQLLDWGATLSAIVVPDRQGKLANVTLSFPTADGYIQRHPYFGSSVGRYCNRIAKGAFTIDGKSYTLAVNNGPNHLHGGLVGFDAQRWDTRTQTTDRGLEAIFTLVSPDGQEGYPGTLTATATYIWSSDDSLTIEYSATTDKPTHVNLTNHVYLNLGGAGSGKVTKHRLKIHADDALDVDSGLVPTGKFNRVSGTPLDFVNARAIGENIDKLSATKGFDHCYVIRGTVGTLRETAEVVDPASGRTLKILSTQPGVQLYTGNHLGGGAGEGGFGQHEAFCLETQHYPDCPNQPEFPSTLLRPGATMKEVTVYQFGVE